MACVEQGVPPAPGGVHSVRQLGAGPRPPHGLHAVVYAALRCVKPHADGKTLRKSLRLRSSLSILRACGPLFGLGFVASLNPKL